VVQNDVTVWNILHDGSIVGLECAVPGDMRVTVEIEYIRELLPDPGDRFVILLTRCNLLEYRDFVGNQVLLLTDLKVISAIEPEILSARTRDQTVVISMTRGPSTYMELHLQYEGLTISVESGREVPMEELVNAARRYWEGFGRRL
jgi:hypothetical protein